MTREEGEARDRLLFHLENQTGFWFALVVGDDPRPRARLREAAETFCREHRIAFTLHAMRPEQLSAIAADLARGGSQGLHWIRADGPQALIAQWESAARDLLLAMNERREAYRKRLSGGVIIEGRESLKRLLRDLAPDLFSIRAFIAEPGINAEAERSPILEWREPVHAGLSALSMLGDPDRELERATRLTAMDSLGAQRAGQDALLKGVIGLLLTGRAHEAARWREELFSLVGYLTTTHLNDAKATRLLVSLHFILGMIAFTSKRLDEARENLDEALSLIKVTLEKEGDAKSLAVALTYSSILGFRGNVLAEQGDLPGSVESLRERLNVLESLVAINEYSQEMTLASTSAARELVDALRKNGDSDSAEHLLRKMVDHEERHSAEQPAESPWLYGLFWCRRVLGDVLAERGDLAGALEQSQAALRVAEDIEAREPTDQRFHFELWLTHQTIRLAFFAQNDWSNAINPSDLGLKIVERELERQRDSDWWSFLAAISHTQRAESLHESGDVEGSKSAILSAWMHTRGLPPDMGFGLTLYTLIQLHIELGVEEESSELAKKASLFKRAVKLSKRAVAAAPQDPTARRYLVLAYTVFALSLKSLGRLRAAQKFRRKARALRRRR